VGQARVRKCCTRQCRCVSPASSASDATDGSGLVAEVARASRGSSCSTPFGIIERGTMALLRARSLCLALLCSTPRDSTEVGGHRCSAPTARLVNALPHRSTVAWPIRGARPDRELSQSVREHAIATHRTTDRSNEWRSDSVEIDRSYLDSFRYNRRSNDS